MSQNTSTEIRVRKNGFPYQHCGAFLVCPPQSRASSEYLEIVSLPAQCCDHRESRDFMQNGIVKPEFGGYLVVL